MQTRQGLWCLVSGFEVFSQVGKFDGIHLGCGQSLVGGTDSPDVNSKADYQWIVMHYVYLNIPNCQRRADNYVAIYGFLRTMTLIACIYFDYFFLLASVYSEYTCRCELECRVDSIADGNIVQCIVYGIYQVL